jgi:hypothetical protein
MPASPASPATRTGPGHINTRHIKASMTPRPTQTRLVMAGQHRIARIRARRRPGRRLRRRMPERP